MRILFIQGGSRLKRDASGRWFTDGNFNEQVWRRYVDLCDQLSVILRRDDRIYADEEAAESFSRVPEELVEVHPVPDCYRPYQNFIKPAIRREIAATIDREVSKADRVIIRSAGNVYCALARRSALRHGVPYLAECTGFISDGLLHHGPLGVLKAVPSELSARRVFRDASATCYVTEHALQQRYPSRGRSLGCSDVDIESCVYRPEESFDVGSRQLRIGTAAFLDVAWKGQEDVLHALAKLRDEGNRRFVYSLVGLGSGDRLRTLTTRLGLQDQVEFVGGLSHAAVLEWMDGLDVYVQPSFQEGLCRAIVEAMSRGCPVVCTDVGGNSELVSERVLYKAGEANELVERLKFASPASVRAALSRENSLRAEHFTSERLSKKRSAFYAEFLG